MSKVQMTLGKVTLQQSEAPPANTCFDELLAHTPSLAETHNNRGNALQRQGRLGEAVRCYQRALSLKPDFAAAYSNLGNALCQQGRLVEAVACCDQALALAPGLAEIHNNRGNALQRQGRLVEAVRCYQWALSLKPDFAAAYSNLGAVLQQQGKLAEAIPCYRRAIALRDDLAEAHRNLGNALFEGGQIAEAIAACRRAITFRPNYPEALAQLAELKRHACDWRGNDLDAEQVRLLMRRHPGAVSPFSLLSQAATPADQLLCARQCARRLAMGQSIRFSRNRSSRHRKIRLGYLSADLRDHAVAYGIAELIEKHDRTIFDVNAYSYGPDDGGEWRRRLHAAFDRFTDIRTLGDEKAARHIHNDGVDILIDLTGYTRYARTRILTFRPSPVQVNYLGYLGTMGADFIDYILADSFIIPVNQQPFYTEKIVHLSRCWWPAAHRWKVDAETPSREACGLPPQGLVFCCFNNLHKLTPGCFDIWARVLKAVPGSVLWLAAPNGLVRNNLRYEAVQRGVAPDRLAFGSYQPIAKHLARHRVADVFLDTVPYNACGTAYDALWAGLPVLTCVGATFAGRVAGTILRAAGLPELITASLEEYEALALRLAKEPGLLAGLRRKLARNRGTMRLFDCERSTRDIEAAYLQMWETWCSGQAPKPFAVGSDART